MLIKLFRDFNLLLLATLPLNVQGQIKLNNIQVESRASNVTAYYHTPEGVTFKGIDQQMNFDGDFAYAPVNKWLQTTAEPLPESADFKWTYPMSVSETGVVKTATSTAHNFQFRMKNKVTCAAPQLDVTSRNTKASYSLATDGIIYGEYGSWSNFAVNYQPGHTLSFDQAHDFLSTNDDSAMELINISMAGGLFSDIEVHGFGESFYDCGSFYLEAVNAFIYSPDQLTTDDLAIKVFHRKMQSVDYNKEIAQLSTNTVTPLGENKYYVEFRPAEPTYIASAMQIVILPAEGKETQFSPLIPLQDYFRSSNSGTASLYSTFSMLNQKCKLQCLDFFGTEMTDENDQSLGILNHWAIGVKGSYEKPEAGIDDIFIDNNNSNEPQPVYNLSGIKVGLDNGMESLPAGFYLCRGRKILKK